MGDETRDVKTKDQAQEEVNSESPDGQLELLKQELEKVREEARINYDQYLRALAEMENIRKRSAREREDYIKYATVPFIKKVLPIIDDLERALNISVQHQDYASLHKGVEMILKSMQEMIKTEGVQAIEATGKIFDPEYHEPLVLEESTEHPSNTVIEEMQKGYVLHGRVIRPSLVKVSN